jgi:2'-hydroxyisoflavone reductase
MIAPGDHRGPASLIDVRDLAGFMVHLLEQDTGGTFNAAGPATPLTFGEMLAGIRASTAAPVNQLWLPADFLAAQGVGGRELPMWSPEFNRLRGNLVENATSIQAGLAFIPLADTARDTLQWHRSLPDAQQVFDRAGLAPEREAAVIAAWQASAGRV